MTTRNLKFQSAVYGAGFPSLGNFAHAVDDHPSLVSRILNGLDTTMERKQLYCKLLNKEMDVILVQQYIRDRYGKKYSPEKLFDNLVSKTDYPIDLSHLESLRGMRSLLRFKIEKTFFATPLLFQ